MGFVGECGWLLPIVSGRASGRTLGSAFGEEAVKTASLSNRRLSVANPPPHHRLHDHFQHQPLFRACLLFPPLTSPSLRPLKRPPRAASPRLKDGFAAKPSGGELLRSNGPSSPGSVRLHLILALARPAARPSFRFLPIPVLEAAFRLCSPESPRAGGSLGP